MRVWRRIALSLFLVLGLSGVASAQNINDLANWGVVTTEFHFTTAQTDAALVTVTTERIAVLQIAALLADTVTVTVGVRVGLAAATLAAASSSGVVGIVLSHPGLPAGSGYSRSPGPGLLALGVAGEDLRLTSDVPTGGSLRILVTYVLLP